MSKRKFPKWYYEEEPKLEKELRLILKKFRIWYFEPTKKGFDTWIKKLDRFFSFWLILLIIGTLILKKAGVIL